jgi:phosphotransferase system  glucose/maltose/N-acetylglucosamine-specific IIC component
MKGFFGGLILGICLIIAVALLVGSVTFPEAIGFLLTSLFWIIVAIVVIIIAFFAFVILLALT